MLRGAAESVRDEHPGRREVLSGDSLRNVGTETVFWESDWWTKYFKLTKGATELNVQQVPVLGRLLFLPSYVSSSFFRSLRYFDPRQSVGELCTA